MKEIFVSYPVDWIMGHLRYGHMEGNIKMTDEEYEEFQKDPVSWLKGKDRYLDLLVDDYEIEDYSNDIYDVDWKVKE